MGWIHGSEEGRTGAHGCKHGNIGYGSCPIEGCYLFKPTMTADEEAESAETMADIDQQNGAIAALPPQLKVKVDKYICDVACNGYSAIEFTEEEMLRLNTDKIQL